jgi:hypothetical protein
MLARLGDRRAVTNTARFSVDVGPWIARERYNPEDRLAVDVTPPASALSAGSLISIELNALGDAKSTGDENVFLRLHLPRRYLENLRFYWICINWKDQGWGNRKGQVGIADGVCPSLTPEVADHAMSQSIFSAPFKREHLAALLASSGEAASAKETESAPPLQFFMSSVVAVVTQSSSSR